MRQLFGRKSCLVLAAQLQNTKVTTIEGLATDDGLDPVQRAFVEYGAIQCGYCSPGFIMAARAFLDENPNPPI